MTIPNAMLIQRDDWIELSIMDFFSGGGWLYKIYPNGVIVQSGLPIGYSASRVERVVPLYEMLSAVADITHRNIEALLDDPYGKDEGQPS